MIILHYFGILVFLFGMPLGPTKWWFWEGHPAPQGTGTRVRGVDFGAQKFFLRSIKASCFFNVLVHSQLCFMDLLMD